ncbi:MAG: DMT family transporter [Verrucomicrobia bacterium]|nr:DMT family transporter [Verrucomicrobiota bacterium]MDE3047369.1 DMT family transporter [Verrucomicrobiota bacterium]
MTTDTHHSRKHHNRAVFGVLLMLGGLALYALSDAFIKQLMGSYSVKQTTFLRAFTRLIPLLIVVFMQGGVKQVFQTAHPTRHITRLIVNLGYTYAFMFAYSQTTLTTVYTLGFTSSFFMIALSALMLKEKISPEKWIAVAVGMGGVLIAMRPGTGVLEIAGLIVLLGAFLGSLNKILMRRLASTEHSLAIAIYPNIAMILVTFPFLISSWQPISWHDWGFFAIIGIITSTGQYAIAHSLRFAQGSTLAPIDYSSFLWVFLLDYFWWNKMPDRFTVSGAAIIVASNLYILYRSRQEQAKLNPQSAKA